MTPQIMTDDMNNLIQCIRYERGLPHIFLPWANTGPRTKLDPEKGNIDFFQLVSTWQPDAVYNRKKTDGYAKMIIEFHPDQNKSTWNESFF